MSCRRSLILAPVVMMQTLTNFGVTSAPESSGLMLSVSALTANSLELAAAATTPELDRAYAVGAAAGIGVSDILVGNARCLKSKLAEQRRKRAGRRNTDSLALQVGRRCNILGSEDRIGHTRPVAADDLDIGTLMHGGESNDGARFETIEFSGDQSLQRRRAAGEFHHVDIEIALGGKATFGSLEQKSGIALRFDDAVFPRHIRSVRGGGKPGGCHQGSRNGKKPPRIIVFANINILLPQGAKRADHPD